MALLRAEGAGFASDADARQVALAVRRRESRARGTGFDRDLEHARQTLRGARREQLRGRRRWQWRGFFVGRPGLMQAEADGRAAARDQGHEVGGAQRGQAAALKARGGAGEVQVVVRHAELAELGLFLAVIERQLAVEAEVLGGPQQIFAREQPGRELREHRVFAVSQGPTETAALRARAARRFEVAAFDTVHTAVDAHLVLWRDRGRLEQRGGGDDLEQAGRRQARLRE